MADTCKHLLRGAPDCVFCHRDQLKHENELFRNALERIKQVRYGLEQNATDEERAEYWGNLALSYRQIASEALRGAEHPSGDGA